MADETPKDLSPDGNVGPQNQRRAPRRFTAAYKARILQEADKLGRADLGALLRREGLHSHQLSAWRKQRDLALQKWLGPQRPGPKPAAPNPFAGEHARLLREKASLERRLKQAESIIEVQRRVAKLLSIPLTPPESSEYD